MRIGIAVLALGLLLGACGGGSAGDTPKETFDAMKSAFVGQDWGDMYDLMSPDMQKKMEERWKGSPERIANDIGKSADEIKAMSGKDLMISFLQSMVEKDRDDFEKEKEKVANSEFVREEINGDRGKVYFKRGERERSMDMVLVDGKWYLDEPPF